MKDYKMIIRKDCDAIYELTLYFVILSPKIVRSFNSLILKFMKFLNFLLRLRFIYTILDKIMTINAIYDHLYLYIHTKRGITK